MHFLLTLLFLVIVVNLKDFWKVPAIYWPQDRDSENVADVSFRCSYITWLAWFSPYIFWRIHCSSYISTIITFFLNCKRVWCWALLTSHVLLWPNISVSIENSLLLSIIWSSNFAISAWITLFIEGLSLPIQPTYLSLSAFWWAGQFLCTFSN